MALYFLVHDADLFDRDIRPALAAAWARRSFKPCEALCTKLQPACEAFARTYHLGPEPALLQIAAEGGLPFSRQAWHLLVGEILLFAAVAIPELQSAPQTLACLLGAGDDTCRPFRSPIQQAHFGSRELSFGPAFHRPEQVGWNDAADVRRLAQWLETVMPDCWSADALRSLDAFPSAEDRAEELEFARDWFPDLVELYRRSADDKRCVVCEVLES